MPELGEIKSNKFSHKLVWTACIECGKLRWVKLVHGKPECLNCRSCAGRKRGFERKYKPKEPKTPYKNSQGYIMIPLSDDDFFVSMRNNSTHIFEHRLVMAKHLGRCLHSWEDVHHKNGIRDDNRIENLQLLTKSEHTKLERALQLNNR